MEKPKSLLSTTTPGNSTNNVPDVAVEKEEKTAYPPAIDTGNDATPETNDNGKGTKDEDKLPTP